MTTPRRLSDPPIQMQAAASMGKLVAQGVLEHGDALEAVFVAADAVAHPGLDRSGLRARLSWAISDSAEAWRRKRSWAEMDLRRGIRPLLDRRQPALAILREAHRMNERAGEPMLRSEVSATVAEELQAALRALRPSKGHRRVS